MLTFGKIFPCGSCRIPRYHMIAPDSKIGRLPAEWSTMAGILFRENQDRIQTLGIGCNPPKEKL